LEPENISLLLILSTSFAIFVVFASVGKQIDFLVEFSAGILGVVAGFSLARSRERWRNEQTKKDLLHNLREELEGIKSKLTGEGHLHFPDIWDSAVSSGQILLLSSEQVTKLASVYRNVRGTEHEAKRVRDLAEEYRLVEAKVGRRSVPEGLFNLWNKYSNIQRDREKKLLKIIEELLKEEW